MVARATHKEKEGTINKCYDFDNKSPDKTKFRAIFIWLQFWALSFEYVTDTITFIDLKINVQIRKFQISHLTKLNYVSLMNAETIFELLLTNY